MAIPNFKETMFPVLKFMADGQIYPKKLIIEKVAKELNISDEERQILLPSKTMYLYENRIGWGLSYMVALGKDKTDEIRQLNLIDRVGRGTYQINKLGIELSKNEAEFIKWCNKVHGKNFMSNSQKTGENLQNNTPDENLNLNLDEINNKVKSELLDIILQKEPKFFENLALKLLEKIGYGVIHELTENGADGGIDGIVNEDILGFSKIYIQAKRFDKSVVGRPEIQKFVGVLATKPTKKGLFITTSKFSKEAINEAEKLQGYSLILIDGDRLLDLMFKYKLGVYVKETKERYDIDNDFFDN